MNFELEAILELLETVFMVFVMLGALSGLYLFSFFLGKFMERRRIRQRELNVSHH